MGYMTFYYGKFNLDRLLDNETFNLLVGLASTRRMIRDTKKLEEMGFGEAKLFGTEGELFFNPNDFDNFGQSWDDSILDYNNPPGNQPYSWLTWIPTDDRKGIIWNETPNSYHSELWIQYIVEEILKPRGYVLNGLVKAEGEEQVDNWQIKIIDNVVTWTKSPRHCKPRKIIPLTEKPKFFF